MSRQQSLFNAVKDVFATNSRISNKALYRNAGEKLGISETEFSQRESIGTDCMHEYGRGGAERFKDIDGYTLNNEFGEMEYA